MSPEKFRQFSERALSTVYSEVEEGNYHTVLIPQLVDKFAPMMQLPDKARILDIGCGQGVFMDCMERRDQLDVTGVTLDAADARACELKGYPVLVCDFSDLAVADGSVDLVWCRHALEHSPYPLFSLYEFERVLKKGGKLYVEVPAPDCQRVHESNPNHYSVLGATMWMHLFHKAGLQAVYRDELKLELTQHSGEQIPESYLVFILQK
jgi:ubiquinone/menaquinone biosynthesis C-methylase UbiE